MTVWTVAGGVIIGGVVLWLLGIAADTIAGLRRDRPTKDRTSQR